MPKRMSPKGSVGSRRSTVGQDAMSWGAVVVSSVNVVIVVVGVTVV